MKEYKIEFIAFALGCGVLKFGDFTLKSGRKSPYFFNAGLFNTGAKLRDLGRYYAEALRYASSATESRERVNVVPTLLFGPAYKGIPLVSAVVIACADVEPFSNESPDFSDLPYAYNRKESKDHGEGGTLVGSVIKGQQVVIIDDVITAGTAIKESADIIYANEGELCGVVVALDRQEKMATGFSAIETVERDLCVPVFPIITLDDIIEYLQSDYPASTEYTEFLPTLVSHKENFCV